MSAVKPIIDIGPTRAFCDTTWSWLVALFELITVVLYWWWLITMIGGTTIILIRISTWVKCKKEEARAKERAYAQYINTMQHTQEAGRGGGTPRRSRSRSRQRAPRQILTGPELRGFLEERGYGDNWVSRRGPTKDDLKGVMRHMGIDTTGLTTKDEIVTRLLDATAYPEGWATLS